jgi:NADPH-dependent 2,4-dienoyl-CoA reductase/sulfur reductase-like enzyme
MPGAADVLPALNHNADTLTGVLQAKMVTARNVVTGEQQTHAYDALVLSPGAAALKPPLPGVDLPGIFSVKTIPDRCGKKIYISWYLDILCVFMQ